jgi:hypothetical protein
MTRTLSLLVALLLLLSGIHSFSTRYSIHQSRRGTNNLLLYGSYDRGQRVVVIGKVIIDQYGDPSKRISKDNTPTLTVGGGGPQACWGAAAALACRDLYFKENVPSQQFHIPAPPKQPITFIAPIGLQNWSKQHSTALESILLPLLDVPPLLVTSEDHITPTINIWHDENEIQKWHPVDGSFDAIGADGLWRNRPSGDDILAAVQNERIVLHCILESGSNPAGQGMDSQFLDSSELMSKIDTLGIEPIVFPDESTLKVSDKDGQSVDALISRAEKALALDEQLLVVTPDRACFESIFELRCNDNDATTEIIVRDGANGSFINHHHIPSATLATPNQKPVNPTGAGNAYSASYVVCRGTGSTQKEAAVLATAVGAVVCEYDHLPDWSWDVLQRIADAAKEVDAKLNNVLNYEKLT